MAPWWIALDLQSVAHLRQRVPGIPRVYFEHILGALAAWEALEYILSSHYLFTVPSMSIDDMEIPLDVVISFLHLLTVLASMVAYGKHKYRLLYALFLQMLYLALAIASWAVSPHDAARQGLDRPFDGRAFALGFLPALAGFSVASYLYWNMFIARDPFGNVNFGGGEVPDLMPYTDEEAYQDEDGPLARLYALQRSRSQPSSRSIEVGKGGLSGGNGSGSGTLTKSTDSTPHLNEPNSAIVGGGTGISVSDDKKKPKDTSGNTPTTDCFQRLLGRRALPWRAGGLPRLPWHVGGLGAKAFGRVVAFIVEGLVIPSASTWAAVEAGRSKWRIGWMNIALLLASLLTVPAAVKIHVSYRNPSPENPTFHTIIIGMSKLGYILSTALSVILLIEVILLEDWEPNETWQTPATCEYIVLLSVVYGWSLSRVVEWIGLLLRDD